MTEFYDLLVQLRRCSEGRCRGCQRSHAEGCRRTVSTEAADAIEELQGRAKVLEKVADKWCEAVPQWIPVTERLPEPGWYLVRCNEMHKHIHRIAYYCDSIWYEDGNNITKFVTHWVRLPEPPKEDN